MKYQKTNAQLKHAISWARASESRGEELTITEMYFERGTGGLVRLARGLVMSEGIIRVGNRQVKTPCEIQVTWSYIGKCTDWQHHRLPQFDLELTETPEERRLAIEEWNLRHKPSINNEDDTQK